MKKSNETPKLIKVLPINHIDSKGNPIHSHIECIGENMQICKYIAEKLQPYESRKSIIGYDQIKLIKKGAVSNPDHSPTHNASYRDN